MKKEYKLHHRKRNVFLKLLVTTNILCVGLIIIVGIGIGIIQMKAEQYQKKLPNMSTRVEKLDADLTRLKQNKEKYKSEIERLEGELSYYQEVIIPESIQKNR